ncbi:uncharacterized protein K02A2.6-like [Acropora millepora]|uniref:uncharacterized protein K02A2.6-like n=1 Tax=Acropora millepora TaxID=45264 RepID=UPI001CF3B64A|nr:uncharacterized protein K02A2.6-like [Acropora millepora]
MGRDWLSKLKLDWHQISNIQQANPPKPKLEDIVQQFPKLFDGKLGTIKGFTAELKVKENVVLDEKSQPYVTITTHLGLYRYTRLPFGVAAAPAIFQQIIDKMLDGLSQTGGILDDLIVTGENDEQHARNLYKTLKKFEESGAKFKKSKCVIMQPKIEYFAFVLDRHGIHPSPAKVQAILDVRNPQSRSELQSFLGLVNYYRKFIPNMSTLVSPLNQLLSKDTPWYWSPECKGSFQALKDTLALSSVLAHYSPKLEVQLAVDASPVGLGAVMSHITEDGTERPIAYASRSLTKAERNYSVIEKEALAIIFGIRKLQQYLYGRKFTLLTDHQPLTLLFGPKRGIPPIAGSRLQRWAIQLSAYQYEIRWPDQQEVSDNLKSYYRQRHELTVEDGCLLRGTRVVIPVKHQEAVLAELHLNHPGIVRMKALARLHVWWPILDSDIEQIVRNCEVCQTTHGKAPLTSDNRWIWPHRAGQRVYVDYCGPLDGKSFLVIKDAKSKWIKVLPMSSTTAEATVQALRVVFSTHGLPEEIVSDNGPRPQFIAQDFRDFLKCNHIKHLLSAPYHPASNGEAERAVRTFKQATIASKLDSGTLAKKTCSFLLSYRSTPHTATG